MNSAIPNNGKKVTKNIPFLELYIPKDKWSNDFAGLRGLLEDNATGYFSEKQDEITEVKALAIIKKLDEANEAGKQE